MYRYNTIIIIIIILGFNARRSPMSHLFLLSLSAIGIGSGVLGFRSYWCPSPFPSPSILDVFHLSAIGFQSCFFFMADVSPPIQSTLHLLTIYVSFQAWDWLWYPMLWSQRRNSGAHGAEN